jgi:hypothetical protein
MAGVRVTKSFDFVFRRDALFKRGVKLSQLIEAMGFDEPSDSDEFLLSFGPYFDNAAETLEPRLKALGFEYYDDYWIFDLLVPDWLDFRVSLADERDQDADT